VASATQLETIVTSGPPAKLGFGNAPLSLEAGTCSSPIMIQAQDSAGRASPVTSPVLVTVTTTSTVAALYADPTCTNTFTQGTIAPSGYQVVVYLKDAVVEPVTVNAKSSTLGSAS